MQFELTREFLEHLQHAIDEKNDTFINSMLDELHAADVSAILYELNTDDSIYVVGLIETELTAGILRDLEEDTRVKFLKNFTALDISKFVRFLDSDDAADILNEQDVQLKEEVISLLDDEKAENIIDLLNYDEDCAGGLMAKELIKANLNWTVVQCIEEIRRQAEKVDKIYSVYVVDDKNKLLGRVSLKKLLLARDNVLIADVFDDDVIAIETFKDEDEVAEVMRKYDLDAIPVINVQGKLMGRITIDDIVDVMKEQADEERQLMSGVTENIERNDSIWLISRARLPWLIVGVLGGLLGARVMGVFENDLKAIPAMAFFIPLIMATGGNVGIQASSIVVQSLATKSMLRKSVWQDITKAMIVAMINGLVISGLVYLLSIVVVDNMMMGLVVGIALFCVVLLASLMGTITPLILDRFNINPALASGPFITTANDLVGIGVYFLVASLLLDKL